MSASSLHRESTDSLIIQIVVDLYYTHETNQFNSPEEIFF